MNVPGKFRLIMEEDRLRKEAAREAASLLYPRSRDASITSEVAAPPPPPVQTPATVMDKSPPAAAAAIEVCLHERAKDKFVKPKE